MKKAAAILLAGVMGLGMVGALAGCNHGDDNSLTNNPGFTAGIDPFERGTGRDDDLINWNADTSTPITIKGLYPEMGLNGLDVNTSDTAKIIEKTTGYKVEYKEIVGTGDDQVRNTLMNRDEHHFMKLTSAQFTEQLENETFLDLTGLLCKTPQGRKIKELIGLMDYGWESVTYTDTKGHTGIYGIPDFGYCMMEDSALVWNNAHLKEIGYVDENGSVKIPSTLTEVTDALFKLQNKYGSNTNYHAFGIGGENSCRVTPFMSAFDCPIEFGVDDEGNIQLYIYDDSVIDYCEYMNMLKRNSILSASWQNSDAAKLCSNFADGLYSCVFMTYWWVTPLVNAAVAKGTLANDLGITNDYQTVHDDGISWNTRIRADGYSWTNDVTGVTYTAPVHEKAKLHGGDDGVSYYTVIPYYMADEALNTIDFLAKKLENFAAYYGGEEGTHWNKVDAPAGAPDISAWEEDNFCMRPYEDYKEKIIFMDPYSYKTTDGNGNETTVSGGGYWIQLTDRYIKQIADNSQYCNGTNRVEAKVLFHLRETGFDAWQVTVPMDDTIIKNPMSMMPPLRSWSNVNILSRTKALRGVAAAMSAEKGNAAAMIQNAREGLKTESAKKGNVKYYYWSDAIVTEMTSWFTQVKPNWPN